MNAENETPEDDTAKVPILGHQIDRSVSPEEDETQKNQVLMNAPSKWKCPWCDLTVFDEVNTDSDLQARSCYKCGAIGIIGKVSATDPIIDKAMSLHKVTDDVISSHAHDRIQGLADVGIAMKSGYLEMEEHDGEGSQGLWFRPEENKEE